MWNTLSRLKILAKYVYYLLKQFETITSERNVKANNNETHNEQYGRTGHKLVKTGKERLNKTADPFFNK